MSDRMKARRAAEARAADKRNLAWAFLKTALIEAGGLGFRLENFVEAGGLGRYLDDPGKDRLVWLRGRLVEELAAVGEVHHGGCVYRVAEGRICRILGPGPGRET